MITINPQFEIGQEVFYATPEGSQGIVLDIIYKVKSGKTEYLVTFGRYPDDTVWCDAIELAETKVF